MCGFHFGDGDNDRDSSIKLPNISGHRLQSGTRSAAGQRLRARVWLARQLSSGGSIRTSEPRDTGLEIQQGEFEARFVPMEPGGRHEGAHARAQPAPLREQGYGGTISSTSRGALQRERQLGGVSRPSSGTTSGRRSGATSSKSCCSGDVGYGRYDTHAHARPRDRRVRVPRQRRGGCPRPSACP